jgi:hypothetical protein
MTILRTKGQQESFVKKQKMHNKNPLNESWKIKTKQAET